MKFVELTLNYRATSVARKIPYYNLLDSFLPNLLSKKIFGALLRKIDSTEIYFSYIPNVFLRFSAISSTKDWGVITFSHKPRDMT